MSEVSLYSDFYRQWLSQAWPWAMREELANCSACSMVAPQGLTRDPGPFQADLKCCTYFPFVPNFSLGSLLEDSAHAARVRVVIASGVATPLGLFPSESYRELRVELGEDGFGQARELLCPFFDSAREGCSIWSHRPAVCSSYFCRSSRGAEGLDYWTQVEAALNTFEWSMAHEALWAIGFTADEIDMTEELRLSVGNPNGYLPQKSMTCGAIKQSAVSGGSSKK